MRFMWLLFSLPDGVCVRGLLPDHDVPVVLYLDLRLWALAGTLVGVGGPGDGVAGVVHHQVAVVLGNSRAIFYESSNCRHLPIMGF